MSESENTDAVDQEAKIAKFETNSHKRFRHRKKQVYENILKQMEFYFSDANLSKDRFLGELVKNDPYVPIAEFLKFNKIRCMTQDVVDIMKAVKHSTFLELSSDKLKVGRKTPMMPYDADTRTVYVESIPATANREWLERVFSDYGHVAYISLPKFKNSHKIKGYAFVEFQKPQDAQKCLNVFTKMGCKLPTCMPPEELSSIKMFSVDEPCDEVSENKEECEPPKKKPKKNKDKKAKSLELKLSTDLDNDRREDTTPSEDKSILTPLSTPGEESKLLDVELKEEKGSQDEGDTEDLPRKKKNRKRTSKDKAKLKKKLSNGEAPKDAIWGLQVLPKSEWKSLRNKYLNLQRKYMKEIKSNLQNKRHAYMGIPAPAAPSVDVEPVLGAQGENAKNVAPLEKIPGVFVKEVLPDPCLDVRLTKRTIKTNIHALHVDIKEGQSEAIIRFDSAKAADEYCRDATRCARVVCGAEEEEQWARAEAARTRTRTRDRGRTRLLARAALAAPPALPARPASPQPTHTHIRFDE